MNFSSLILFLTLLHMQHKSAHHIYSRVQTEGKPHSVHSYMLLITKKRELNESHKLVIKLPASNDTYHFYQSKLYSFIYIQRKSGKNNSDIPRKRVIRVFVNNFD